jgi:voltage-gated potassium channel
MSAGRRFVLALVVLVLLTMAGTAGYVMIEGMSLIDAVYMSVISISTVGFAEVKALSPAGQLFTIGPIVTGIDTALYLFAVVAELLIEGKRARISGKTAMKHPDSSDHTSRNSSNAKARENTLTQIRARLPRLFIWY